MVKEGRRERGLGRDKGLRREMGRGKDKEREKEREKEKAKEKETKHCTPLRIRRIHQNILHSHYHLSQFFQHPSFRPQIGSENFFHVVISELCNPPKIWVFQLQTEVNFPRLESRIIYNWGGGAPGEDCRRVGEGGDRKEGWGTRDGRAPDPSNQFIKIHSFCSSSRFSTIPSFLVFLQKGHCPTIGGENQPVIKFE